MTTTTDAPPTRRRWTDWIGYVAAGWAAAYLTIALVWTVTGSGFPFGEGDPDSFGLLRNLPAATGAPLFAGGLLVTTVLMLVMAGGSHPPVPVRRVLQGTGWLLALALLVLVPEPDVLALVGYAPVLLVAAPFGWLDVNYAEVFSWPLLNQLSALAGGFLVAATVLAWQRRTRPAGARPAAWTSAAAAARWGRWAVGVAMAVPLLYAATRYAWLLGIPLFATDEFVEDLHADGAAWAGAWLATFAVIGAVLTLGLVQRWGERFPRWLVGLSGRRVPILLAVIPASVVSALVTSAGLGLSSQPSHFTEQGVSFWFFLPQLLWPVWGAALAAAALAYYLRRRVTPGPPVRPGPGAAGDAADGRRHHPSPV